MALTSFYSRDILIGELSLFILHYAGTWFMMRYVATGEDMLMATVVMFVISMVQMGGYSIVMGLLGMRGAVVTLGVMRVMGLVVGGVEWASWWTVMGCYVGFKVATTVVGRSFQRVRMGQDNPNHLSYESELRRREWVLGCFGVSVWVLVTCLNIPSYTFTPTLVFLVCILTTFLEINFISAQHEAVTYLTPSLLLNCILYLVISMFIGYFYSPSFMFLIPPALLNLSIMLGVTRIWLAIHSRLNSSFQPQFFRLIYPFSQETTAKMHKGDSWAQKMLRRFDSFSRYLCQMIYYCGFGVGVFLGKYSFLAIGAYLINNLPVLDQVKLGFMARMEQKYSTSFKIRPHITVPLVVLLVAVFNKSAESESVQIWQEINQCDQSEWTQLALVSVLIVLSCLVQGVWAVSLRKRMLTLVKLLAPAVVWLWVYRLECQHWNMVLLGVYALALALRTGLETSFRTGDEERKQ